MNRFELLAPAGSAEALRAAVNAGADAVYIGGSAFGARAYADNPDSDSLIDCIRFCHLRGRKVYLTVNTLFKEDELENRLFSFLRPYYEEGLDAVIVQDIGAIDLINSEFPGLPIHLSTQAAITMAEGTAELVDRYKSISRVVPARELSLEEIREFKKNTGLELEIFVHGALCYCYSGQCLMSSMIGGRSGNRGRCAQPCRKLYDGKYLLSPKDQCILGNLHELMDIGINSFKIEGRMKSPEYTAGVVSVYRRYIDKYIKLGPDGYREWLKNNNDNFLSDIEILQDLYNRGGFNDGYLKQHNGPDMMTFNRPNHSGVKVGEVIEIRGREAVIRFDHAVNAQDIVEIRSDNHNVFEFTLGNSLEAGSVFSCITMKDKKAARGMEVYRVRNNALLEEIRSNYIDKDSKVPVEISFSGREGEASVLTLSAGANSICVQGNTVEPARNAPSDEASVKKQLTKLGETDFTAGSVNISIGSNVFIPSGELNRLRRDAAEALKEAIVSGFGRSLENLPAKGVETREENSDPSDLSGTNVIYSVRSLDQLGAVTETLTDLMKKEGAAGGKNLLNNIDYRKVEIYYNISSFDINEIETAVQKTKNIAERDGAAETVLWIGLPYISRRDVFNRIKAFAEEIGKSYPRIGFVVRSREELNLIRNMNLKYRTDYNLYVMNSRTKAYYNGDFTLPLELTSSEIRALADKNAELIVFGRQPVMFSAQCVYKNKFNSCKGSGCGFITVTDELGHDFRCVQQCAFCCNIIYNSARLNLLEELDDIEKMGLRAVRFDFTFEESADIEEIMRTGMINDGEDQTFGLYKRGVQ